MIRVAKKDKSVTEAIVTRMYIQSLYSSPAVITTEKEAAGGHGIPNLPKVKIEDTLDRVTIAHLGTMLMGIKVNSKEITPVTMKPNMLFRGCAAGAEKRRYSAAIVDVNGPKAIYFDKFPR